MKLILVLGLILVGILEIPFSCNLKKLNFIFTQMRSLFTIEADKDKKFSYNLKASFSKPYRPKKKRKKPVMASR